MAFTIFPSIDLRAGRVVRLQQGDFDRQINYDLDPADTVRSFIDAGANIVHIVDLDGAKAGRISQLELIGQIVSQTKIVTQVGGGVRSDDDIRALLSAGVSRVVVGTAALRNWAWFEACAKGEFAGRLVLAIDAKDGIVATHGWTESSGIRAIDLAEKVRGWPVAGLLYTDVSRDGMLGGANADATAALAAATDVPVIASGGVGSLDHIRDLLGRGIAGVILGRSLHDGRVKLAEAIRLAREFG